jgi:hypothetical protein
MESKKTIVREAVVQDFEKTYPLFEKFKNPQLLKEDWRQLFVDHWQNNKGFFGYVLEGEEGIVGFLGLIFSRRSINGKEIKFCNITSWVVAEKFRSQSLSLFLPVLKLKDYTLTIHTASKETYAVARKLGFQDLESHFRVILPLPSVSTWLTSCKIEVDGKNFGKILTGEALQVYKDHLAFKCFHVHVRTPLGECNLIGTRVYRKKLAFSQIHHISHSKIFSKFAGRIAMAICSRINTVAIVVDERFLQGNTVMLSKVFPLPYPRVCKPGLLGVNDIDLLYSEFPVLNL